MLKAYTKMTVYLYSCPPFTVLIKDTEMIWGYDFPKVWFSKVLLSTLHSNFNRKSVITKFNVKAVFVLYCQLNLASFKGPCRLVPYEQGFIFWIIISLNTSFTCFKIFEAPFYVTKCMTVYISGLKKWIRERER